MAAILTAKPANNPKPVKGRTFNNNSKVAGVALGNDVGTDMHKPSKFATVGSNPTGTTKELLKEFLFLFTNFVVKLLS